MAKKPAATTSGFRSYALSDQGVRTNNEDVVYADDERGIYFVIDGMGGHAAGEQAAQIARERLRGRLERATGTPQQRIREAIALANNAIFETAAKHPDWNGMACVLTVALISSGTATIGHVGDSRLYKLRGTSIDKITHDHSPVGELEDGRQLSEAEAMAHPRRNEVYRDVGSAPHDPDDKDFIDIYTPPAEPDSAWLLCSDGLTDAVPLADIRRIIRDHAKDLAAGAQALIDEALRQKGKDNISVVLLQGPAFGSPKPTLVPPVRAIFPTSPIARTQLVVSHSSLGQGILQPVLWMALGAALFFGAQQAFQLLHRAPPPPATRTPAVIAVDVRRPNGQPTLAAALSLAQEGDTIELAPGIYEEPFTIGKSNLLIDGSGAILRPKPTPDGVDGITITRAAGIRIRNLRIAGDADGDLLTGIRIVDSQVALSNVQVAAAAGPGIETSGSSTLHLDAVSIRDCGGPGLILRGDVAATIRYSAFVSNGRDPHDRQPGILLDSSLPAVLAGNTLANNGGPAIVQPGIPSQDLLTQNLFSLDGRKGRLDDIRVTPRRVRP